MTGASELAPGVLFAGKFMIERRLGEGGMGTVWVAMHQSLQKRVALKVLSERIADTPEAAARMTREAIAAAAVNHPGVVAVYDADTTGGTPWIAMELLDGESLGARIERGPLPIDEAVAIVVEALDALAHVHRAGIVHRDLKPDNLFLARLPDGSRRVKLLDFGIAAGAAAGLDRVTRTGMTIGTPAYFAPEQASGQKDIDGRVDVYAMGVVLFEALTGDLPYRAETLGEMVRLMYTQGPRRLADVRPDVAPQLSRVVELALAVDRDSRIGNAEAFARELVRATGSVPARTTPVWVPFVLGIIVVGVLATAGIGAVAMLVPFDDGSVQPSAGAPPVVQPIAPVVARPPVDASLPDRAIDATVAEDARSATPERGGATKSATPSRRPDRSPRERPPDPSPATPQPLDTATFARVLGSHESRLDGCYYAAYPTPPGPRIGLRVEVRVAPAGHVTSASANGGPSGLERCVVSVLRTMRFPEHPVGSHGSMSLTLYDDR